VQHQSRAVRVAIQVAAERLPALFLMDGSRVARCTSVPVPAASIRGRGNAGRWQSNSSVDGKGQGHPSGRMMQLGAYFILPEGDAAQLRQADPVVRAGAAYPPKNQAERRIPQWMACRPNTYGNVTAFGLEDQVRKLSRTHLAIGKFARDVLQSALNVHITHPLHKIAS
jgi:hypothetical protein